MTRIADLLDKGKTYSFEFFPPKNDAEQATLVTTLRELEPLSPSFVSVTYRGGAESRRGPSTWSPACCGPPTWSRWPT